MSYIGVISQLVSDVGDTAVKLKDADVGTPDNYLRLRIDHGNYSAIFSIFMVSFSRNIPISIRVIDGDVGYIQAATLGSL